VSEGAAGLAQLYSQQMFYDQYAAIRTKCHTNSRVATGRAMSGLAVS
jgi:hypothetical protein